MDEVDVSKFSKKERREYFRDLQKEQAAAEKRKKQLIKWGVIGIALILLGFGGWWVVKEALKPLPGQAVADQGRTHIPKEEWEKFHYNSNPPTSGPHDGEWIRAGIFDTPQGDGHLVHSLEHGYIILSYNCSKTNDCEGLKRNLAEVVKEKRPKKLIVVPRPTLDTTIALTAWTQIDKFNQFDKNRISRFVDAFRDRGPEKTIE